jgi:hypothetical protein
LSYSKITADGTEVCACLLTHGFAESLDRESEIPAKTITTFLLVFVFYRFFLLLKSGQQHEIMVKQNKSSFQMDSETI